jgi:hypothetical protein
MRRACSHTLIGGNSTRKGMLTVKELDKRLDSPLKRGKFLAT